MKQPSFSQFLNALALIILFFIAIGVLYANGVL